MKKFKTHVILLSDQVLMNVLPALDYNLKPDKVILCASDAMQKKGVSRWLTPFFKSNNIKVELFKLGNANDLSALHKKLNEIASRFESRPADVAVNLSGDTGPMCMAAQSVFAVKNITCLYAVPKRNEIVLMKGGVLHHHTLQDKIKLNDYFIIHGCSVAFKREKNLKLMSGSHALCRDILADFDKYGRHVSYLSRLASGAENYFSLKARAKITPDNKAVFDIFLRHGFLSSFDENIVQFASKEDRSFCKGIWLEDYLHQTLKSISKDVGLQDFATCVEFKDVSGKYNDLDAAFLHKNRLYVIEARMSRGPERGGDEIFQLESLSDFDQACTSAIVVSFRELRNPDVKRAKDSGVHLIQGTEIADLEKTIRSLLNK